MAVVLLPVIALWIDRPAGAAAQAGAATAAAVWTRRSALRSSSSGAWRRRSRWR